MHIHLESLYIRHSLIRKENGLLKMLIRPSICLENKVGHAGVRISFFLIVLLYMVSYYSLLPLAACSFFKCRVFNKR